MAALFLSLLLVAGSLLLASATAADPVSCAYRQLALQMSQRNIGSQFNDILGWGLNISECSAADAASVLLSRPIGAPVPSQHQREERVMMRKKKMMMTTTMPMTVTAALDFYVSASSGRDSNSGTSPSTPFKTLLRAQTAVRQARTSQPTAAITVNVMAGTYFEALTFTPADSGAAGAPVVWQAMEGDKEPAIISGGVQLSCKWTQVTLNNRTVMSCSVPNDITPFDELFVNSTRLKRARFPNGDPSVPASGYTAAGAMCVQRCVVCCVLCDV